MPYHLPQFGFARLDSHTVRRCIAIRDLNRGADYILSFPQDHLKEETFNMWQWDPYEPQAKD